MSEDLRRRNVSVKNLLDVCAADPTGGNLDEDFAFGHFGNGDFLDAKWPKAKRSEEHTSELQSRLHLVCRLLLEKKKNVCIDILFLFHLPDRRHPEYLAFPLFDAGRSTYAY